MMERELVIIFYPHIGEYGGIERNIQGLAAGAQLEGRQPVLLCYYDRVGMDSLAEGLKVVVLGDHWNPWIKAKRLKEYLIGNAGIIHGLPLFFGAKAGFYAAVGRFHEYALHYTDPPSLVGKPLSTKKPSALARLRNWVSEAIVRGGVSGARRCLTMTAWNARELESIYGRPFDVISQGGSPPVAAINTAQRCRGKELRLFSICRLTSSKNLDWILQAVVALKQDSRVKPHFERVRAVIAGKGPELERLQQIASDLGVEDSVDFPGFLTPEALESEYSMADLFVVPGRQGYGLPILEAMYRHVPVVLNRESRISEILGTNPWAAISEDSAASFATAACAQVAHLVEHDIDRKHLLHLPTEAGWAKQLGQYCGWWA